MAYDRGELAPDAKIQIRLSGIVAAARLGRPEGWEDGDADPPGDHAGPVPLQRDAAGRLPVRQLPGGQEGS